MSGEVRDSGDGIEPFLSEKYWYSLFPVDGGLLAETNFQRIGVGHFKQIKLLAKNYRCLAESNSGPRCKQFTKQMLSFLTNRSQLDLH